MISIQPAVRQYGAERVYQAACAAMEGDYSKLANMGIEATSLGDAWRVQSAAYKSMTVCERAKEQMLVNGELMRLKK